MNEVPDPGNTSKDIFTKAHNEVYRARMLAIGSALENNLFRLNLGPSYFIINPRAKNYSVNSVFSKKNEDKIELFLFAKSAEGNIVGDLHSTLRQEHEGYLAEEYLEAYLQGEGVASALEHAHLDLLQMESNQKNIPITWRPRNQNLRRLNQLKSINRLSLGDKEINLYDSELKMAIESQARWQALFGSGKKFGTDSRGERIFYPNQQVDSDLNQTEFITLVIKPGSGNPISREAALKNDPDPDSERDAIEKLVHEIKYFS